MVVAPFVPEAAVRDATAHWFEVFIETGTDFLGSGERDARVSDEFRAVLVQELGDGARRPAGDQLEGIGRVVVLAGEDRPLALMSSSAVPAGTPAPMRRSRNGRSAATRKVTGSPSSAESSSSASGHDISDPAASAILAR
jgi:hypothetical protein